MSNKRTLEDLFVTPLKLPRTEFSRRIATHKKSNSVEENMSESGSQLDGHSLDNMLYEFYEGVDKEERFVFEVNYELSSSLLCGTGYSVARGFFPVVKIAPIMKNIFSTQNTIISFIHYDWSVFVVHLKNSIMNYLNFDNQQEEVSEYMFNEYIISFTVFLGEKCVKLKHRLSHIYLNKASASRLCDLAEIISLRMNMLENIHLADKYFEIIEKAALIMKEKAKNSEIETCEETSLDLVKSLASLCEPSTYFCICEILLLDKTKVLKDLTDSNNYWQ